MPAEPDSELVSEWRDHLESERKQALEEGVDPASVDLSYVDWLDQEMQTQAELVEDLASRDWSGRAALYTWLVMLQDERARFTRSRVFERWIIDRDYPLTFDQCEALGLDGTSRD